MLPPALKLSHSAAALRIHSLNRPPCLLLSPFRTTATTGCRSKNRKKITVIDNRLTVTEAVNFLHQRKRVRPHHSINAFITVNAHKGMPQIRGNLALPEKVSKNIRILCFAEGEAALQAKAAGAEIIGAADLLDQITDNKLHFDLVVSTPELFPLVTRIAKYLGPKGLMPSAKKGTVTNDIETTILALKNSTQYSSGKTGSVNVVIGRIGFTPEQVNRNLRFVMKTIMDWSSLIPGKKKVKRAQFVDSVQINSTFTPALPLQLAQFHHL